MTSPTPAETPIKSIVIASDHAGYRYKRRIIEYLTKEGYQVEDMGTDSTESVDYPDFIMPAARAVAEGKYTRGIVLGGSGNGEAIAANRIKGVRCAVCWNEKSARLASMHNNANMISIGERMVSLHDVYEIIDIWLSTPFEGGRHARRIEKLDE
ncbi:ribose 5-phosphate isomerase B [Gimesia maris]|uniref:ribose 5-phosphate isomerase B n=1 Tax=Gimesia maris TaxID=122 RepID=UPI00241BFD75|nr:ribose 5-phosphate isomerase B [Gimesia maris]|tara:strand:+ start:1734 stop:2195 length:462 start_codon:yes stop_codon:yes gene_type:complete